MSCGIVKCLQLDECCKADTAISPCCTENATVSSLKKLLERMRRNCIKLGVYHNSRYNKYRRFLFYLFRLPSLILSGVNGFFAIGLKNYTTQTTVSVINAVISFVCGIITSIEISLNLQKRMESELDTYKKFYKLTVELDKELTLFVDKDENARQKLREFTEKKYNEYQSIVSLSNIVTSETIIAEDEFEKICKGGSTNENNEEREHRRKYNRQVISTIRRDANTIIPDYLLCCFKKPVRLQEYSERLEEYERLIEEHLENERIKKEKELLQKTISEKEKQEEHNKKVKKVKNKLDEDFKNKLKTNTDPSNNEIIININDYKRENDNCTLCSCLPKIDGTCGFNPDDY